MGTSSIIFLEIASSTLLLSEKSNAASVSTSSCTSFHVAPISPNMPSGSNSGPRRQSICEQFFSMSSNFMETSIS